MEDYDTIDPPKFAKIFKVSPQFFEILMLIILLIDTLTLFTTLKIGPG